MGKTRPGGVSVIWNYADGVILKMETESSN